MIILSFQIKSLKTMHFFPLTMLQIVVDLVVTTAKTDYCDYSCLIAARNPNILFRQSKDHTLTAVSTRGYIKRLRKIIIRTDKNASNA